MHSESKKKIDRLVEALSRIRGINVKLANKIAFDLLQNKSAKMKPLIKAFESIGNMIECQICGNIDCTSPCSICQDSSRDKTKLCIVSSIFDLHRIADFGIFDGYCHVLSGSLSMINNIGPSEIGVVKLLKRVEMINIENKNLEILLALGRHEDGLITSKYLIEKLKMLGTSIYSLALGISNGLDVSEVDDETLVSAIKYKIKIS